MSSSPTQTSNSNNAQQQVQLPKNAYKAPVKLNVKPQLLRVAEGVTHYAVPGYN